MIRDENQYVHSIIQRVRHDLIKHGNSPSDDQLNALSAIPHTLLQIEQGKAKPAMYVCGLDVGLGKTTTLKRCIELYMNLANPPGIILCLGRLEQISSAIKELGPSGFGLPSRSFAVLTAKNAKDKNGVLFSEMGVGVENINKAFMLITTHKQLELRLKRMEWHEAREFFYRGEPRPIRLWDEALTMRRSYSIGEQELHRILGIQNIPGSLRQHADNVLSQLKNGTNGDTIDIPEIDQGLDIVDIVDNIRVKEEYAAEPIRNLFTLSGREEALIVKHEDNKVAIQYDVNLPHSLLPLIVLDASARDRAIYDNVEKDCIVSLPNVEKSYERMTIHVKNGSSGHRAFWKNIDKRMKEAAEIIDAHPDRKVLIIAPKERTAKEQGLIRDTLDKHLGHNHNRDISFIHWGIHDAVNDYRECNLVICLTFFHKPYYVSKALAHAIDDVAVADEHPKQRIVDVQKREMLSDIRQGIGRSCVRTVDGLKAKECVVYLQAETKKGIKEDLEHLFPRCNVVNHDGKLSRHQEVLKFIEMHGGVKIYYPEVYESLGMQRTNFSALIKSVDMQRALHNNGWKVVRGCPCYF